MKQVIVHKKMMLNSLIKLTLYLDKYIFLYLSNCNIPKKKKAKMLLKVERSAAVAEKT
jgi:hypothetical protein